jgi:hypothetical protein
MHQALFALLKNPRIFAPLLLLAGTGMAFGPHSVTPLFSNTDQFVLFATEHLTLEEGTQVSSGDLGSNDTLKLDKDALITGNLFAKTIDLKQGTVISGNADHRKLKTATAGQVLGTATGNAHLPIANLPALPAVTPGTANVTASGIATLPEGAYKDITVLEGSTLTLDSGTYHLRSLVLKNNATLLFTGSTTINIQRRLRGYDHVAILPKVNTTKHDDLTINYVGSPEKQDKNTTEDDDAEIDAPSDTDQEQKDWRSGKSGRLVLFGAHTFLNLKLHAPKASVTIGKESTVRGQVVGKRVKVKKNSILSRTALVAKEVSPAMFVTHTDGAVFPTNIIMLNLVRTATEHDAINIASPVGGIIVGHLPASNTFQIEVSATTPGSLDVFIQTIRDRNDPLVEGVFKDYTLTHL